MLLLCAKKKYILKLFIILNGIISYETTFSLLGFQILPLGKDTFLNDDNVHIIWGA